MLLLITQNYEWYQQLTKPSWAPPAWLFGPVWTVLYLIIIVSFGYVFIRALKKNIPGITVLPFIMNLIFNLAFTPIQFGLKSNILAAVDIILVLGTLVWSLIIIKKKIPWVFYTNIPYLLWVVFATVLQFTVTLLNL